MEDKNKKYLQIFWGKVKGQGHIDIMPPIEAPQLCGFYIIINLACMWSTILSMGQTFIVFLQGWIWEFSWK